jgi:hypothetical protein
MVIQTAEKSIELGLEAGDAAVDPALCLCSAEPMRD